MRMQATSTAIMAAVTWVALTGLTSGDIRGPYASDESTISLWHMEPSGDPVAIPDGAGVRPLDAAGLQGAFQPAGRPEMGQCYDASWRDPGNTSTGYLLGAGPSGEEGTGLWGNIPRGPFTIEMLVSPLRILDPDPLDDEPSRMSLARGEDIS